MMTIKPILLSLFLAFICFHSANAQWEAVPEPTFPLFNKITKFKGKYFISGTKDCFFGDNLSKLSPTNSNITVTDLEKNSAESILLAVGQKGLYKLDNATNKFSVLAGFGVTVNDVCFDGATVYAATSKGIYSNNDIAGTGSWKLFTTDSLSSKAFLKIEKMDNKLLVQTETNFNFFFFDLINPSNLWKKINISLNPQGVNQGSEIIFNNLGLWRSYSSFLNRTVSFYNFDFKINTWKQLENTMQGNCFVLKDIVQIGTEYVFAGDGIIKTTDNGKNYVQTLRREGGVFQDNALFAEGNEMVSVGSNGIYQSQDKGSTWVKIKTNINTSDDTPTFHNIKNIGNTKYMITQYGIFEYNDSNKSWTSLIDGLPNGFGRALLGRIVVGGNDLFYADHYWGMYKLNQNTKKWQPFQNPKNLHRFYAPHSINKDTLIVSADDANDLVNPYKIFLITNGGTTWKPIIDVGEDYGIVDNIVWHKNKLYLFGDETIHSFDKLNIPPVTSLFPSTMPVGSFTRHAISFNDKIVISRTDGIYITDANVSGFTKITSVTARQLLKHGNRLYLGTTAIDTNKVYASDDLKNIISLKSNLSKNSGTIRSFAIDNQYLYTGHLSSAVEGIFRRPLNQVVDAIDISEVEVLSLSPNPTQDFLQINKKILLEEGDFNYDIFDIQGKVVQKGKISERINVSTLTNGTYFLNIQKNNFLYSGKFIKI